MLSVECAQVAEWLMAADCKSAAPCELRRFESSPVHQVFRGPRRVPLLRALGWLK